MEIVLENEKAFIEEIGWNKIDLYDCWAIISYGESLMRNKLLEIFDDTDSLSILIALFHWNPRTLGDISEGLSLNQSIAKKGLNKLVELGMVNSESEEYEISSFGKVYVQSLGVSKEELNKQIDTTLQRVA